MEISRWEHTAVRTASTALIVLAAAGVLVGLLLPWTGTGARVDLLGGAGMVFLAPILTGTCLAYAEQERAKRRLAAGIGAAGMLATAVIAGAYLRLVDPLSGIGIAGPLVVVAGTAGVLGWMARAFATPGPLARRGVPLYVALGVVAAVAVLGGAGVFWYVEARFVDHQTVAAQPVVKTGPPASLDRERWRTTTPGTGLVGISGRNLVVRDATGVRAIDASTGEPRWRYLRGDAELRAASVTAGTAYALYANREGVLAIAVDVSTGEQRWTQRFPYAASTGGPAGGSGPVWDPDRLVASPDGSTVAVVGLGLDAGDVIGLDARTGERRWVWPPVRDGARCGVTDATTGGSVLTVAMRCRATGVRDNVVALSTVDGLQRWTWSPEYTAAVPTGDDLTLTTTDDGVVVRYGRPRHAMVLAAGNGRSGALHLLVGEAAGEADNTLVYVSSNPDAGELTGVNSGTGQTRWTKTVPELAGGRLAASTAVGGTVYLLMRVANELAVAVVQAGNGTVAVNRVGTCTVPCVDRPAAVVIGPQVLVLADTQPDSATLALAARTG